MRILEISLLLALVSTTSINQAYCQVLDSARSVARQQQYKPVRCLRKRTEYQCKILSQTPSIPGLPEYAGLSPKVLHGIEMPNDKAGSVHDYRFCAHERPEQVARWYKDALTRSGWCVNELGASAMQVYATKGADTCCLAISPSFQQGFATQVMVLHQQGK